MFLLFDSFYFKCLVLFTALYLTICGNHIGTELTCTLLLRLDLKILLDQLIFVVNLLELHRIICQVHERDEGASNAEPLFFN